MKLQPVIPVLWTNELDQTIDFYVSTLGFICGDHNDDWGWAALHLDGCDIMLAKPNQHTPFERPEFTGTFYIKTDDVDSLWKQWSDKANVLYAPETFEWGMREFGILDNNGYRLVFGQDIV